jgi:hypothetical protein
LGDAATGAAGAGLVAAALADTGVTVEDGVAPAFSVAVAVEGAAAGRGVESAGAGLGFAGVAPVEDVGAGLGFGGVAPVEDVGAELDLAAVEGVADFAGVAAAGLGVVELAAVAPGTEAFVSAGVAATGGGLAGAGGALGTSALGPVWAAPTAPVESVLHPSGSF